MPLPTILCTAAFGFKEPYETRPNKSARSLFKKWIFDANFWGANLRSACCIFDMEGVVIFTKTSNSLHFWSDPLKGRSLALSNLIGVTDSSWWWLWYCHECQGLGHQQGCVCIEMLNWSILWVSAHDDDDDDDAMDPIMGQTCQSETLPIWSLVCSN